MAVIQPAAVGEVDAIIAKQSCVINFCADWCEPCGHMNMVFSELAKEHRSLSFVQVDADALPDLCDRYKLESVPSFLFFHARALVDTVLGADAATLSNKTKQHNLTAELASDETPTVPVGGASPPEEAKPPLDDRLKEITHSSPVMVFIKGSPDAPRCGFSRQICELLTEQKVRFGHFDILTDEEVRQGLKTYSNWPTYPQLYADGKLVGGLDIVKELKEEGELLDQLPASAVSS